MTNNKNKNNNNKLINEKSNQGKNSILKPATTLLVLLCKCRNTERTVMNGQSRNTATVDTKQNKWI